jgi:uncharacterized membrane protein
MAMTTVEKTVDVDVPVSTAYNQWTQFESFPHFMEGVENVQQLDDTRLHWRAKVGGQEREWDAVINEQVPDERIAWHSTSGSENAGTVMFQPMASSKTRVTLRLGYDPEGFVENVGDKLGFVSRQVDGDLDRFKKFVEERGAETGAWRGEVHRAETTSS